MFSSPASSPFQFSTPGSQQPQPQQQLQFQFQQQQQQQQQQQMPGLVAATNSPHVHLLSNDRSLLSYQAKWADINDESKNVLLAIEEKMLEYREESRRLDQCQRLYDSPALHKGFELESIRISQELGAVGAAVAREQSSLADMVESMKLLMRNAEVAVRSFMALRPHFARLQAPALTAGPTQSAGSLALSFSSPSAGASPAPSAGPASEFYSGIPTKPSVFLQQTVSRFEKRFLEYGRCIEELERLLQDKSNGSGDNGSTNAEMSLLQSLPTVMTNVHDFFIHVAAEVESLHQKVEVMRTAFIADRRRRGDDSNPFLEADRREIAKREVAEKRVHPTLNAPLMPLAQQMPGVGPTPSASYGPGSVQNTPFAIQSSTPSLFGTPGTVNPASSSAALGQSGSAPVQFAPSSISSSLFGSSAPSFSMLGASTPAWNSTPTAFFGASTPAGSAPQSSLFGANYNRPAPSGGLFAGSSGGAFGGASSGNMFGSPAQPQAFGTPAATTPMFGMTAAGAGVNPTPPLFGMGATGQAAAVARAKPRGPRRK